MGCLRGGNVLRGGIDNALAERLHAAAVRQQCINLTPRKARADGGARGPRPDGGGGGGDELGHPRRACV